MIKARFWRNQAGQIYKFKLSGHSGYAPAGEDLICAAVSAAGQTAIGSLEEIAKVSPKYQVKDGLITCEYQGDDLTRKQEIQIACIMETVFVACQQTVLGYGKQYLEIKEER